MIQVPPGIRLGLGIFRDTIWGAGGIRILNAIRFPLAVRRWEPQSSPTVSRRWVGKGSGTSQSSGSGPTLQPAQDVFYSGSKSVCILSQGRARQVALPVHLYFRNKEPVSLPQLQQIMATGSLIWLNWNLG